MQKPSDFFSLTGLPFDPPVNSRVSVKKAILEAVTNLSKQRDCTTEISQRMVLQSKIDFLNDTISLYETIGWNEATKNLIEMAEVRRAYECERVRFTASLLVQNGVSNISKNALRVIHLKTGLSYETLLCLFKECGLQISAPEILNKYPKFPLNSDGVLSNLAALREIKNPNSSAPDSSLVTDLYTFAAYLIDDLEHANLYHELSTSEIKTIFDLAARKYAQRNDNLGKLCGSISAAARHYVFDSEENRKCYDALLNYKNSGLQSLFDALKMIPKGILLQPDFAEKCINLIRAFFPDYETALSIYNKEGNLMDFPYVPHVSDANHTLECSEDNSGEKRNSKSKIYGIDLGSTYSVISTLDDCGLPEIIPNYEESSDFLASAVYFPEGSDPVVGEAAKGQKDNEPERVVEFVKKYIGKPYAPTYEFDGIKYDPITISALILKRMKAYAEEQGHNVKNVVITCPAYFGNEEKSATKQAAIIAGMNVLDIIHEPTAAALFYLGREMCDWLNTSKKILVYDLGGATFDLTLFDITADSNGQAFLEIIKSDGDDCLGGIDWDDRMFHYICEKFANENDISESEIDSETIDTFKALVEQTKRALSPLAKKSIQVKVDGEKQRLDLTREEFAERTKDLVERTLDFVHRLLSDVNLDTKDIDLVLLVGGSTFMPMIKTAVEKLFPGKVRIDQPNLAVAKGAALYAAIE